MMQVDLGLGQSGKDEEHPQPGLHGGVHVAADVERGGQSLP